jgi:23S rRNA pseudouridine2604 synthase
VRINKYLAQEGFSTRRGADELVARGLVFINGKRALLGAVVKAADKVEVRQKGPIREYAYLAFHKPAGMDTHEEPGRKGILSSLPGALRKLKLFPLGRLDKNSRGLIILTNDGRITDRLLNPKYEHEKVYEVKTKEPLRQNFKERMEKGVRIERYTTKPCRVDILGEKRFRITLTEGKTHQVRRMVVALFNEVEDLKRVRVMNIELGKLPPGAGRMIEGTEQTTFLRALGLTA